MTTVAHLCCKATEEPADCDDAVVDVLRVTLGYGGPHIGY